MDARSGHQHISEISSSARRAGRAAADVQSTLSRGGGVATLEELAIQASQELDEALWTERRALMARSSLSPRLSRTRSWAVGGRLPTSPSPRGTVGAAPQTPSPEQAESVPESVPPEERHADALGELLAVLQGAASVQERERLVHQHALLLAQEYGRLLVMKPRVSHDSSHTNLTNLTSPNQQRLCPSSSDVLPRRRWDGLMGPASPLSTSPLSTPPPPPANGAAVRKPRPKMPMATDTAQMKKRTRAGGRPDSAKIEAIAAARMAKDVEKMMATARAKFVEMDADKSGRLEAGELGRLGDWVCTRFASHGGKKLTQADREGELAQLQAAAGEDGELTFEEFDGWFRGVSQRIFEQMRASASRTRSFSKASKAVPKIL
jgi:hypothetical protein